MILGASREAVAYGRLTEGPDGTPCVGGTLLSTALEPFFERRVRLSVYAGGFEPHVVAVGRVEPCRSTLGDTIRVAGMPDRRLPYGEEAHVEIVDLGRDDGDVVTAVFQSRWRSSGRKREVRVQGAFPWCDVRDGARKAFDGVPPIWDGCEVTLAVLGGDGARMGALSCHHYERHGWDRRIVEGEDDARIEDLVQRAVAAREEGRGPCVVTLRRLSWTRARR